jgi:hypothetical protein
VYFNILKTKFNDIIENQILDIIYSTLSNDVFQTVLQIAINTLPNKRGSDSKNSRNFKKEGVKMNLQNTQNK